MFVDMGEVGVEPATETLFSPSGFQLLLKEENEEAIEDISVAFWKALLVLRPPAKPVG